MAFQRLLVVLLFSVQGSQAKNATSASPPASLGNLIHCPCGATCQKDLGTWHIFNVGQSCMCGACSSQANLRGSVPQATPPAEEKQTEATEFLDWDSGMVPSSNLLYCRCGSNGWVVACHATRHAHVVESASTGSRGLGDPLPGA